MDCRAQRCSERRFFYAHAGRISALRARAESFALRDDVDLARVRINVEGDLCDRAARAPVAGLLAAATSERFSRVATNDYREDSIIRAFGCRIGRNHVRADRYDGFAGTVAAFAPTQKRRCQFDRLSPANVLADRSGRVLSASARSIKHLDRPNGCGIGHRDHTRRDCRSPETSGRICRMVLVSPPARSRDRHRSSRSASAG